MLKLVLIPALLLITCILGCGSIETSQQSDTLDDLGTTFTWGSTKQEVLNAQGEPDHTSPYEWNYGHSSITFNILNSNVVSGWDNAGNLNLTPILVEGGTFTMGTTKQDVLKVQGNPDYSSPYEWRYGDSSITFSVLNSFVVIGWNDAGNLNATD